MLDLSVGNLVWCGAWFGVGSMITYACSMIALAFVKEIVS